MFDFNVLNQAESKLHLSRTESKSEKNYFGPLSCEGLVILIFDYFEIFENLLDLLIKITMKMNDTDVY